MIHLRDVGIEFTIPRHSRLGRAPRLFRTRSRRMWGLRHLDLEVGRGEVLGLVGPNGAGKSTLLRLIAGVYTPDEGAMEVDGRVGALLSLSAGLMPQLSGWENIALVGVLLGLSRSRVAALAPDIAELSGLGEFLDAEVRTYSSGMRSRLGFSISAVTEPDILVLDEVLAVGDEEFRERSGAMIRRFVAGGGPVVVASHELDHLRGLATRVAWLESGAVERIGAPDAVIDAYAAAYGPAHVRSSG